MKKILAFCVMFGMSFGTNLEDSLNVDENISLEKENKEISKQVFFQKPKEYKQETTDLGTFASKSLGNVLNLSSNDTTESNVDYNALNISIKSINTLLDYENSTLLLEKQARFSQDEHAYSLGLINRYDFDQFKLGFNAFNDQYSEDKAKKSFGTEVQFSDFFKAYANRYDVQESNSNDSTELGVVIDVPYFKIVNINTNIKETQKQYNITYSPFSLLDLSLNYQDEQIAKDQTSMWVKIKLSYEQNLIKQLYQGWYQKSNIADFKRYGFATRTY